MSRRTRRHLAGAGRRNGPGTFPPPPPDWRYVMFGGRIVLVDAGFRVRDFITFDVNLGP